METILKVVDLSKVFPLKGGSRFGARRKVLHAIDSISFEVKKGEIFGIVGESGCGKSTLSRMLLGLIEPTSGKIVYKGSDIQSFNRQSMKSYRRKVQMIFQDPYSSLNPRLSIFDIVSEPIYVHKLLKDRRQILEKVKETLAIVDLPTSDDFLRKLPKELSGGQRQRIGIARSLIAGAEFIIADESVSMLDATIKAKITSLLEELRDRLGLTYIFITHEIGIAYYICNRIAVMYLGQIMEFGDSKEIINTPMHPYTRLLMEAVPPLQPDENWGNSIEGRSESTSTYSGTGCRFCPRCPNALDVCKNEEPQIIEVSKDRLVNCHLYFNKVQPIS